MATRGPYDTHPPVGEPQSFSERVRAIRHAWGWTQSQLGAAVNTDQTAVCSWERERVHPKGPTLAALAQLFTMSTEALETGEGFRIPAKPTAPPNPEATLVELSDPGSALALLQDLRSGENVALMDIQETILRLIQAQREGRKIWISME